MADKFEEDLLQKRTIAMLSEINSFEANRVGKLILWLNAKSEEPITLHISSAGGDLDAAMNIYDIFSSSAAPVTGKVYRIAGSSAGLILQACTYRLALPHAEFSLHTMTVKKRLAEIQHCLDADVFADDFKLQLEVYEIFAVRMNRPVIEVAELFKAERRMGAQEALKLGLIDKIL